MVSEDYKRTKKSWDAMRARCLRPANCNFARYGGRGITICPAWDDFAVFLSDMGYRPLGTSLDRINGRGNYEPGNCRWATKIEQTLNRALPNRAAPLIEVDGRRLTAREWSRETGLHVNTIGNRFVRGWTARDCVTVPAGERRSHQTSWEQVMELVLEIKSRKESRA